MNNAATSISRMIKLLVSVEDAVIQLARFLQIKDRWRIDRKCQMCQNKQ